MSHKEKPGVGQEGRTNKKPREIFDEEEQELHDQKAPRAAELGHSGKKSLGAEELGEGLTGEGGGKTEFEG